MAGARLLLAQSPGPTFSADVNVVNVFVTVRDKNGGIIKDLSKEEFSLSEDGRAQTIRYFSRESDLPLTMGLLVDTTPSESNMLEEERRTSRAFFGKMLRPDKDKAFLIQYSHEVELLQDLTSSLEKLDSALNLLERHDFGRRGGGRPPGGQGGQGGQGGRGAYATVLSDAVYLASDEIMKNQKGRKALFVLGDGDHIGSREEMAIAAALHADTQIYTIRIYDNNRGGGGGWPGMGRATGRGGPGMGGPGHGGGHGGPGPAGGGPGGPNHGDGKKGLQTLSSRTGGAYFEVGKKDTLDKIYAKIEEELRSQYSLGYTPDANAHSGYRRIRVDVQRKDLVVQGSEGYYPAERS